MLLSLSLTCTVHVVVLLVFGRGFEGVEAIGAKVELAVVDVARESSQSDLRRKLRCQFFFYVVLGHISSLFVVVMRFFVVAVVARFLKFQTKIIIIIILLYSSSDREARNFREPLDVTSAASSRVDLLCNML